MPHLPGPPSFPFGLRWAGGPDAAPGEHRLNLGHDVLGDLLRSADVAAVGEGERVGEPMNAMTP